MIFKIPLLVRCIKPVNEHAQKKYSQLDFGTVDKIYMVQAIVPNGCYYVLRNRQGGSLMGDAGSPNHFVNMDRFEVIEWMTQDGVVNE